MRIFHWEVKVKHECVADGYLLAEDREDAEEKLKYVPFYEKYENVELDNDDCGYDGCEFDGNGIAIRWEE